MKRSGHTLAKTRPFPEFYFGSEFQYESIAWEVDGRNHILKLWDSGGYDFDKEMVDKFIEDATKIIEEHSIISGYQIGRNTSQYYISPTLQEVVLNMKIHKPQ